MISSAKNKIDGIYRGLSTSGSVNHYGLLGGTAGVALFYAYLQSITQDDSILENLQQELEKSIALYNVLPADFSWGYGVAGLGWLIMELDSLNFLDAENSGILSLNNIDKVIDESLRADEASKDYDCFSGIVGKGLYFLKRQNGFSKVALSKIVRILDDISLDDANGKYWLAYQQDKKNESDLIVNIGMAHGLPSIASFLIMVYEAGIEPALTKSLIVDCCNWILSRGFTIGGIAHFPFYVNVALTDVQSENIPSRHAWCYGDLGIAYTLLYAAETLNIDEYYQIGLSTALKMAESRDINQCLVKDASICHGSSGVAFIFHKLYRMTRHTKLKEAADFWLGQSLDMLYHKEGIGGYKYWTMDDSKNTGSYADVHGFLEGASGVGISLLAYAYPEFASAFQWHKLMLIA
jgi:lantibiotic modifying enzyme